MEVGDKVRYNGQTWTIVCFFPDTLGLEPMQPYDTWYDCFQAVGLKWEIKAQLLIKHIDYSQYLSVEAALLLDKEYINHHYRPKELTSKPYWNVNDLVPNPGEIPKRFKLW